VRCAVRRPHAHFVARRVYTGGLRGLRCRTQSSEHLEAAMWKSPSRVQASNAEESALVRRRVSPEQYHSRCASLRPPERSCRPSPASYMQKSYIGATVCTTLMALSLDAQQPPPPDWICSSVGTGADPGSCSQGGEEDGGEGGCAGGTDDGGNRIAGC